MVNLKKVNTKGIPHGAELTTDQMSILLSGKSIDVDFPVEEKDIEKYVDGSGLSPKAPTDRFDMNKTEEAFAAEVLVPDPDIIKFYHHPLKLRLANRQFLEIDFMAQRRDGSVEFYEVKAQYFIDKNVEGKTVKQAVRGRDDSRNKCRIAAAIYPFPMTIASKVSKKDGGGWVFEKIPSQGLPLVFGREAWTAPQEDAT